MVIALIFQLHWSTLYFYRSQFDFRRARESLIIIVKNNKYQKLIVIVITFQAGERKLGALRVTTTPMESLMEAIRSLQENKNLNNNDDIDDDNNDDKDGGDQVIATK